MNTNRILRKKEVLHLTGISSATLYRLISKGAFPLSKKLTGDSGRAVGWLESDINNWVNSRMQAENKMKEIIAKTSSAKETSAVPWFETMGKQVGLSKRTTAAILREQQLRIRLNRVSAFV